MHPGGVIASQVGGNGGFAAAALGIEYQDTLHGKSIAKGNNQTEKPLTIIYTYCETSLPLEEPMK